MTSFSDDPSVWHKRSTDVPEGFFAAEAAGLRWLAETDTVSVVPVLDVSKRGLQLQRLREVAPNVEAARRFGLELAALHQVPASAFGELPPGSPRYFFGPLDSPLVFPADESAEFGQFYASCRLEPVIKRCLNDGSLRDADADLLHRICRQLLATDVRIDTPPTRTHGDLWSGNLMWTASGVTLIDPAACAQHPMADVAMLTMFGAPYLEEVLESYQTVRTLAPDWREALGLHQLFGYLVHLHLFGGGYHASTLTAARSAAHYLGA